MFKNSANNPNEHYERIATCVNFNKVFHKYKNCILEIIGLHKDLNTVIEQINSYKDYLNKESKSNVTIAARPNPTTPHRTKGPSTQTRAASWQSNSQPGSQSPIQNQPQPVSCRIGGLKWYQIRMLQLNNNFKSLSSTIPNLTVDLNENELIFTSIDSEKIDRARIAVNNMLKDIKCHEVVSAEMHEIIRNITNYDKLYARYIEKSNLCCVIDSVSVENKVFIYGNDFGEIEKCQKAILDYRTLFYQ